MAKYTHSRCLLCNSTELQNLNKYQDAHLVQCKKCRFVFSSQIPTAKELELHYNNYGRNDYLSTITIQRYNELLDTFEPYRKNNKILDIGCGIGYFLEVAKERGWEVYGTEYTKTAIDICTSKGIEMNQGILEASNYSHEVFDVITSFEVIEHINNPLAEFDQLNSILRKGGCLYLTTPNFNSVSKIFLKDKWSVIAYPEHLSYYTPKTLHYLFTKYHYKKALQTTTGISISRMKNSLKLSDQPFISVSSDDEKLRNLMETNFLMGILKKVTNKLLSILGIGDAIKVLYIKR